ncbi:MAG: alpha/beta hydrolase [Planctomycetes bacterium]|nr:alpha/beta hydrolase [Planctomycetota bacterium]
MSVNTDPLPREHWIDLSPGKRLHVQTQGVGPAVLFLPGNGCSIGDAGPLRETVAQHHRFVGVDLPGREPTIWPDEPLDFVGELPAILDRAIAQLDVGAHVVIGHSMGGMLALQHARRNRGTVRGLVLLEGFVSLDVHFKVVAPDGFRAVRMPAAIRTDWEARRLANDRWLETHAVFARTFWESQRHHDARAWVAELDLPILVCVGDLGQPMPPTDDLPAWKRHLGMDRVRDLEVVVVPHAGHWMMLDDPPAVEAPVLRFLRRVHGTLSGR